MEQARGYVCKQCLSPVPRTHKFCGACGTAVPPEAQRLETEYFAPLQVPGRARLTLVKAADSSIEGMTLYLHGNQHAVGRQEGELAFPQDDWISSKHANFYYEDGKLHVRDEGSANGVYIRIREPVVLQVGDSFRCGDQFFRLGAPVEPQPAVVEGTHFYASPAQPSAFQAIHVLEGGIEGTVVGAAESLTIGRDDCDLNFPDDVHLSPRHARLRLEGGQILLEDLGSQNGTFVRIREPVALRDGDYLFIGRELLRVEVVA